MLRLQKCILARLLSSSTSSPASPLQRLLSAAAPRVSPNPSFAVEDYLVDTCCLTRAQTLKASAKLSHIKSPTNPDAVRAFLTGRLGLSGAEVAALVAKDPLFLCAKVDKTLLPIAAGLTGLGLSRFEITRLLSLAPIGFRHRTILSKLRYYLSLFGGSVERLAVFIKQSSSLLRLSLEKVIRPNVAFLRQCGLGDCEISKICLSTPWVLSANPESVQAMVVCAEGLGVPRGSGMYRSMLAAIAFIGKENVAAKLDYLKKTFSWSDADVRIAVCKAPNVLTYSKDMLQRRSDFLISKAGLEPAYISRRPHILSRSLEGRLRPRYYVLKFLKEKGLLDRDRDYYTVVIQTEKIFMEKFIYPHKEAAPYLAEDYAGVCRGEMLTRFSSEQ